MATPVSLEKVALSLIEWGHYSVRVVLSPLAYYGRSGNKLEVLNGYSRDVKLLPLSHSMSMSIDNRRLGQTKTPAVGCSFA